MRDLTDHCSAQGLSRRAALKTIGAAGAIALAAPFAFRAAQANQLVISESQRNAVRQQSGKLYYSASAISAGNEGARLSVAEFFDYNCHVCRELSAGLFDLSAKDKNIRLVFRELPIFGEDSEFAAMAAIAARRQNGYIDLHHALMRHPGKVGRNNVLQIAEKTGLDITKLVADMSRDEVRASLIETRQLARDLNVRGTPTYVVDDILVGGAPRNVLVALIDVVRSNNCNTCRG